jgi:serine/threonine protein kinase
MRKIGSYMLIREIGHGMFSKVFLCKHITTKVNYACKVLDRSKMSKRALKNVHDEIKIIGNIDSPHIVKIFDTIKSKRHFYIMLEYCNGGDLENLLETKVYLTEENCKLIF